MQTDSERKSRSAIQFWRLANSAILLLGFFTPWISKCRNVAGFFDLLSWAFSCPKGYGDFSGFDLLAEFASQLTLTSVVPSAELLFLLLMILLVLVFIGLYYGSLIAIPFYVVLNLIVAISSNRKRLPGLRFFLIPLVVAGVALTQDGGGFQYGCGITWMGLISVVILELSQRKKSVPSP